MKKLMVCSAAVAIAAGVLISTSRVSLGEAAATDGANKVGLIDMAHVFKNYDKFKAQTEALQGEMKNLDSEAKAKMEQIRQLQERLPSMQSGSPEHSKTEQEILQAKGSLQAFGETAKLSYMRKEAEIYKSVYLEVQKTVGMYAKSKNYSLIMRFNRSPIEEAEDPREIIQSMNRQVVFYSVSDDCTDPIVNYLNSQYKAASGGSAAPAAQAQPQARPQSANRAPAGGPIPR